MRALFGLILLSISAVVIAADIPQDVMEAQNFDMQQCISQKADTCINNICITSSALDCQEQCRKDAAASCRAAQE